MFMSDFLNGNGFTKAAIPKIKAVLQVMEPTAFPKARPGSPFNADTTDTVTSGNVVPMLTIVAPIISLENPNLVDNLTASSTKRSAPLPRTNKATAIMPSKEKTPNALWGINKIRLFIHKSNIIL